MIFQKQGNNVVSRLFWMVKGSLSGDLHHWLRLTWLWREQKNEQENNAPNPKNNAAAGYQGPVKIEILKSAGLLEFVT